MAAIEYGLDKRGEKVFANEAVKALEYKCPHCLEPIKVRKCKRYVDYFAHKRKEDRTPQERMCPGYTGDGAYQKIENVIDQVYIENGGIPVYLCKCSNDTYQLRASFPPLSKETMDLLKLWNVMVVISEDNRKEEHSAWHLPHYQIKSLCHWIEIKCQNMQYPIKEVKQKWEWGICGLKFEDNLFHSHAEGGFRVALHSNIIVNKEYLIISNKNHTPIVNGVTFSYKGVINFIKNYKVYSMIVADTTDEAIAFIRNKGHQLITQNDTIIPLWPPCVIQGKELIYKGHDKYSYLYHHSYSEQTLHILKDNEIIEIPEREDIIECNTSNKTILSRDRASNVFSAEIRAILTQDRSNFQNTLFLKPEVKWKNRNNETNLFFEKEEKLFIRPDALLDGVTFESNIENKVVCLINNNYVKISAKKAFNHIGHRHRIIISIEPFGKIIIEPANEISLMNKTSIFEVSTELITQLYKCHSANVVMGNAHDDILKHARKYSPNLYKIMMVWKSKNEIPQTAIKILHQLQEVIKNARKNA